MLSEEWRISNSFPNYEVSSYGRVRNSKTRQVLKPQDSGREYHIVRPSLNGRNKTIKIHRLVAEAFLDPIEDKPNVNHKNGNKVDNASSNLEWSTQSENIKHAYDSGLKRTRKVRIVETGEVFRNLTECARSIDGYPSAIHALLNNVSRAKRHRGYSFEYLD